MARNRSHADRPVTPVPGSEDQIVGRRIIRALETQLQQLAAQRPHPNRVLLLDHVVVAHLLAFFNPNLRGLRTIQDVFDQPHVRRRWGTPRIPRSTLADAQRLFDPQLLVPLIHNLLDRLGQLPRLPALDALTQKLLAVDGTFFAVAPRIAWALFNKASVKAGARRDVRKGNVRAHFQFNVLTGLPEQVALTDGQTTEMSQLRLSLTPDCFYVGDRHYHDYSLLAEIIKARSDFVFRLRSSAATRVLEELPLSAADQAAGVRSDSRIRLGARENPDAPLPDLRRIEVDFIGRDGTPGVLILLTNRFDLPAHLIALIYQHRWQVELFFRWLKCVAHFEHFFSESREGMTLQVYAAIIGTLLIALETGARPSKYDYAMMCNVVLGLADPDEALEAAQRRRKERARAAEWQKAYNARKKAEKTTP